MTRSRASRASTDHSGIWGRSYPARLHGAGRWEGIMTNKASEDPDLEAQMGAATAALREAVRRLLRAGEVHPRLIVLAVARVTGELAASAALAGGRAGGREPA